MVEIWRQVDWAVLATPLRGEVTSPSTHSTSSTTSARASSSIAFSFTVVSLDGIELTLRSFRVKVSLARREVRVADPRVMKGRGDPGGSVGLGAAGVAPA